MTERDPRTRPADPAGTKPKHDPEDLLPRTREPLLWGAGAPVAEPGADGAADGEPEILRDEDVLYPGGAGAAPEAGEVAAATGSGDHAPTAGRTPARVTARIQFVMGALIAVGVAAIAAIALVAADDEPRTMTLRIGPQWSSWAPSPPAPGANPLESVPKQIAEHVGRKYRGAGGDQLVAVSGGPLEAADLPMTIAERNQAGDISIDEGTGVLYRLCGLGQNCAIARGKASKARHLLLRREALELALHTFTYLKGLDDVVVFLPPPKGQEPSQAVRFRRSDVAGMLTKPLASTLAPRTPSVSAVARSRDASLVQQVTLNGLFSFQVTQANSDARLFLVLTPPAG
ncbi:hypothetical protein [Conexibacter sp. SYSU D00693]|uniref:hypothetical protein n=1 Tax=Conexibacter sp. SYSU D00693 TaxID=2812560 RepID=UPI00196AC8B5|nr:hypothetical protein [Conexibacter sp. SYSU D00693]